MPIAKGVADDGDAGADIDDEDTRRRNRHEDEYGNRST